MDLTGKMLIGGQAVPGNRDAIKAINPATDQALEPGYPGGSREHVDQACALAWSAFDSYRETSLEQRAAFLEGIAGQIEALGDAWWTAPWRSRVCPAPASRAKSDAPASNCAPSREP
ncbi:hypothetical protein P308_07650 [Pseudomonas piscis]|nr:hypothetical protein P308_07650 [Pseudomonas piscis]